MDMLVHALSEGKLCVVDVSQMRGGQSLILSGLIWRRIFDRNQQEFTEAEPKTIPTIAVVEEAQSVLNEGAAAAERLYRMGKGRSEIRSRRAWLITQQPGSIPVEILSQGDNWFIFHLLSASDLTTLKRANAHFSDDLLSSLLNVPIPGQGVFWSSVEGKPYPVSIRALSFERLFSMRDPDYDLPAGNTYAHNLRRTFGRRVPDEGTKIAATEASVAQTAQEEDSEPVDVKPKFEADAMATLRSDAQVMSRLESAEGYAWGSMNAFFRNRLPPHMDAKNDLAVQSCQESNERDFRQRGTGNPQDRAEQPAGDLYPQEGLIADGFTGYADCVKRDLSVIHDVSSRISDAHPARAG